MNYCGANFIRDYCLDKFKDNYRLSSDDTELVIPSIFLEDDFKRHMSINLESGLWRCFKSGNTGNFVKLYATVENCSYRQAYEKFVLEKFLSEPKPKKEESKEISIKELEEVRTFKLVKDHPLVVERLLDQFPFYISKSGYYQGRLIIPFLKESGKLFYFQARATGTQFPKYLNCKSIRSSNILYPFDYSSFEPLYITEGVFDCLSLKACGFNATTTLSCFTSNEQMSQLKHYQGPLVCSFDGDAPGEEGTIKFLELAKKHKASEIFRLKVPAPFKDWNEVLVSKGPDAVIEAANLIEPLNDMTLTIDRLNEL